MSATTRSTRLSKSCGTTEQQFVKELVQLKAPDRSEGEVATAKPDNRDEMYDAAVEVIVREGRGSCSLLQRALGIGYGRAARLIDFMAEDGIVGQYNGSQAREVLITLDQWQDMAGSSGGASTAPPVPAAAPRLTSEASTPRADRSPALRSSNRGR